MENLSLGGRFLVQFALCIPKFETGNYAIFGADKIMARDTTGLIDAVILAMVQAPASVVATDPTVSQKSAIVEDESPEANSTPSLRQRDVGIEAQPRCSRSPLSRQTVSRMIHQDVPHHLRRHLERVRPDLPFWRFLAD